MNSKDAILIIQDYLESVNNETVKEALHRAITALEKDNSSHKIGQH